MELVLAILLGAAVVVILVLTTRDTRRAPQRHAAEAGPVWLVSDGLAVVTLDLVVTDPNAPAAQRLVDDATARAFAATPDVVEVEVQDAAGRVLGRRVRERPRQVVIPGVLYEPHLPRRGGPATSAHAWDEPASAGALPGVSRDPAPVAVPHRPLVERFELPQAVGTALAESGADDDAIALVCTLLEAAGYRVEQDGDLLTAGNTSIVVIRAPIGEPIPPDSLNHAFRRCAASPAARGVVVSPGFMDPLEVRRREVMAPEVSHAGPDGIQRMADAVALGADPLRLLATRAFGRV